MAKIVKILARSIGIILEGLLFLIILILFLVRSSTVQTYLGKQATQYFSKEWNTNLKIDRISIVWLDEIALDGVYIEDQTGDTLGSIESIFVNIESINPNRSIFVVDEISIENGTIKINRDKKNGIFNFDFITEYFASTSTKTKTSLDLLIRNINLNNIHLTYDDFRKDYSDFGIDYDHIDAKELYLDIDDLHILDTDAYFELNNIAVKEQSGFIAEKISAKVDISGKGLRFDDLKIKTPLSEIDAKRFHLEMNSFEAFENFEDSVIFNAYLNKSKVNLKDVSYFATPLEGVDQELIISGKITEHIKNLKITDLYLETGKNTVVKGSLQLPDFRNINDVEIDEDLEYAYIDFDDLKNFKLPKSTGMKYIELPANIQRLEFIETSKLRLTGSTSNFRIRSNEIKSGIGSVNLRNGVQITQLSRKNAYQFTGLGGDDYDLSINNFQLGTFLNDPTLGVVDMNVNIAGAINNGEPLSLSKLEGNVNAFNYNNYTYSNIVVNNGKFENEIFTADLKSNDPNLKIDFSGSVDLKGRQKIVFDADLAYVNLTKLNFSNIENTTLRGKMTGNLEGLANNTLEGEAHVTDFSYTSGTDSIALPTLDLIVSREGANTLIDLESEVLSLTANGIINFQTIANELLLEISKAFPVIIEASKNVSSAGNNDFVFSIDVKQPDKILPLFIKDLTIKNNTTIGGKYVSNEGYLQLLANTGFISYKNFYIKDFAYDQTLQNGNINLLLSTSAVNLTDTIVLDSLTFVASGNQNDLKSTISWDRGTSNESNITWRTNVLDLENFIVTIEPSYFGLNGKKWTVPNSSEITFAPENISVENFKLTRDQQSLSLNGKVSKSDADKMTFRFVDFEIDDLSLLIGLDVDLKGVVNGTGNISNPYTNLNYFGDIRVDNFYVNNEEVGSITALTEWNQKTEKVELNGALLYRNSRTLTFDGTYDLSKTENSLDFELNFSKTDISFTNAFLDPSVVSDIDGQLQGKLKIKGTPLNPKVTGKIDIENGQARLALLGALFKFNGNLEADEDAFYINRMPLEDEEGNVGTVGGTILHNNFADWNFDVSVDLNYDGRYLNKVINPRPRLNRFLVMNTNYTEGAMYYGKAYVTGSANISGYADQLAIEVNAKTQLGTKVIIPLFGFQKFEDEISYLTFKPDSNAVLDTTPKYNLTGIDLKLHFDVTPDAELGVILDDKLGDGLTARGNGNIDIGVNTLGDVSMIGDFTVKEGIYNFVFPPIREKFEIVPGGQVIWTGDPTNARIDLTAKYRVNANFADIVPDQVTAAGNQQEVNCLVYLSNTLLDPGIKFDIVAPKATESNQQLLARIKSDNDELNRQFFSLVLFKRFQALTGPGSAGSNAALDLLTSQINNALSSLSKDYKLNVDIDNNSQTGENSLAIGVRKDFLDSKLRISGSFGYDNNPQAATQQSGVVDINIEYLLNQSGSFRVSIFNESNNQSILRDPNQGQYTQGIGLTYQEDFNTAKDFRLLQYFLNIFRSKSKKRYPINLNNREVLLPEYDPTIINE